MTAEKRTAAAARFFMSDDYPQNRSGAPNCRRSAPFLLPFKYPSPAKPLHCRRAPHDARGDDGRDGSRDGVCGESREYGDSCDRDDDRGECLCDGRCDDPHDVQADACGDSHAFARSSSHDESLPPAQAPPRRSPTPCRAVSPRKPKPTSDLSIVSCGTPPFFFCLHDKERGLKTTDSFLKNRLEIPGARFSPEKMI